MRAETERRSKSVYGTGVLFLYVKHRISLGQHQSAVSLLRFELFSSRYQPISLQLLVLLN